MLSTIIAIIWMPTGALLLLLAVFRPQLFQVIFQPTSTLGRVFTTLLVLAIVICAVLSLVWDLRLFDTSVTVLASLGLVANIWVRFVCLCRGETRGHL